MEKIVYLLGAGFSAPLGLPVISNFLTKSRDQYYANPEQYPHFQSVFETVQEYSYAKNYFATDLFNIEEILSILEMRVGLDGTELSDSFKTYISDVIKHYTPEFPVYGMFPGNWYDFVCGSHEQWKHFGSFVASLFSLEITESNTGPGRQFTFRRTPTPGAKYNIVSLNYDLVVETAIAYLQNHKYLKCENTLAFDREFTDAGTPWLAKLHGCVDSGVIVPPTWRKFLFPGIQTEWNAASKLLSDATQVRIIGYSLPIADAYLKYLFKSSILRSTHLKSIDVLTLDSDGSTKSRYDDFIEFNFYRFASANTMDYLQAITNVSKSSGHVRSVHYNKLETLHDQFMRSNAV